jgi:hypothetical protein
MKKPRVRVARIYSVLLFIFGFFDILHCINFVPSPTCKNTGANFRVPA